jgi:exodeoxyribonuclease-5
MKVQARNPEQEQGIKKGIEFIEKGSPDEWLIIGGKAGTGKTTIAQAILEPFIEKKNILVCALSHKAKLVISEKLVKAFGQKAIVSKSVAGALGMNMDQETGAFTLDGANHFDPPIKKATIIIVDEGSMINEESHDLIMKEKRKKAKVIYLGDIRQLPPIREAGSKFIDRPSPVFFGPNYVVLTERIRQGEENPILPFADYFGDNSRMQFPRLNPVPPESRKNIVNDKGALVFADNIYDVIETVLPLYKHAVEHKDMNVIKTVTYRNDTRKKINNLVRDYVFGTDVKAEYLTGELLMFQDNHQLNDIDEPISNSFEIQVTGVAQKTDDYKVWVLEFIYEAKPVFIEVLDNTEIKRHAADVSKRFEYAKKFRPGTDERKEALSKAWGLKRRFAPVEYAYAITSHKSQGSTYNTVVVDERDIMSVTMTSNKSKSQSMYTALTRAAVTAIVIDGHPVDESLQRAVELSTQSILKI